MEGNLTARSVLPREAYTAVSREDLAVITALPLMANVLDPKGYLQTTPIPHERSLAILAVFPRQPVPGGLGAADFAGIL